MSLYRCIRPAVLLGVFIFNNLATAQPLTLRSKPLLTVPANVAQQLDGSSDTVEVREIVADTLLLSQNDWQQQLSHIQLQLSDNTHLTVFAKQRTEIKQGLIWQGQINGKPNSRVGLVITPKGVSGSVSYDGRLWQIRRLQDGSSIMFETEQSLLNADDTVRLTEQQQRQLSASASSASYTALLPEVTTSAKGFTDETRLQVMVYYDIQELETYPDLLELIDLEFLQANNALTNSGVDAQLSAVVKLPISRQNASDGMLSLMLSGEEMFTNLARDRQRYSADLVHYFGLNLDDWACGLAYLSAYPEGNANANLGLGATHTGCMGNLVFAHEIGHNFGAEHDRHVEPDADADFNYGYVDLETSIKTIMAYPNLCDENGKDCETLPYFSSPALEHQGRPLGIAAGEPDAADNQKMLNFSALTLANYAGVGAPTGLTASNNNLAQGINVSWQPLPGATEYELFRSTSCDYDSFKTLVVTTIDTSYADVDASGGRYCYFVQGINDNLISGAQRSPVSLPESGFGSGPALDKIADQYTDSVDQSIAVTFSSGAVVAPSVEIVQHTLPSEPLLFLQDLGGNQFQLTVSNATNNDGSAIVKVTTDRVFEVFSVSFSGNSNNAPIIAAPEQVTFNQQSSTSFVVEIIDSQIAPTNPISILLKTEDDVLIPDSALDYSLDYTETGALLTISINPQHKLFGVSALNISLTDGEHLVSQRVAVNIVRVLNTLPQVPASTTMYIDGNNPLQRLLPVYDIDNDEMEFTLLTEPNQGQLTLDNNAFRYVADSDFSGEDSFNYRVTERHSGESFDSSIIIKTPDQQYLLPTQKQITNLGSVNLLLDFTGQLWAWGSNNWKLFSTDQFISQPTPVALYSANWADIGITDNNAVLIHQDGSLWQLGNSSLPNSNQINTPTRVGNANDWLTVLASGDGNVYCNLLLKSDRSLWAFGDCSELATAGLLNDASSAAQLPVQVSAQYHWLNGSHSQTETVLLDVNGMVWTGSSGFIRYAGREAELAFLAPVSGIEAKAKAVATTTFRSYAQTEEGLVAWGSLPTNAPWQWQNSVLQPTAIMLDSPSLMQVASANFYLYILDTDNALWTAGGYINSDNPNGALGRGDFADRGLAKVDFADGWQQIFASQDISLGLSKAGQLLISGAYDLASGQQTLEPVEQLSNFTVIAEFTLKQLGYTDTDADGTLDYLETDADNDGIADGWELKYGLDRQNAVDAALDTDNDGLSNLQEFELGTNPTKADSDNDAMPDGWELQYGFNPNNASDAAQDADNDQLSNAAEFQRGTLPNNADTDADGMPDGWEVQYGLNPINAADASSDNDADGVTALQEFQNGTNPNVKNNSGNGNTTPPPEQKSSGGSMPITALLLLLGLMAYRRRYIS